MYVLIFGRSGPGLSNERWEDDRNHSHMIDPFPKDGLEKC